MSKVTRYHPVLVILHWMLAYLIIADLFFAATRLAYMSNSSPEKLQGLRFHMTAGIAILCLMLFRLVTRRATSRPQKASTGNRILDRLAQISHRGLYVGVFVMCIIGLLLAAQAGLFGILIGEQPPLPPSLWDYWPRTAHYIVSRLLMLLIALHICGALYHTLILRDGLLRRMFFGRRRQTTQASCDDAAAQEATPSPAMPVD